MRGMVNRHIRSTGRTVVSDIQRTAHAHAILPGDVGVDHGALNACMAQQQLNGSKVPPAFQQVGGKTVPQRVDRYSLVHAYIGRRSFNGFLKGAAGTMMTANHIGARINRTHS